MPADEAFRNDLPAGFAAVVMGIEAVLTKAGVFIGNAVLFPDRLAAVVTGDTVFLNTVIAEQLIIYRRAFFRSSHKFLLLLPFQVPPKTKIPVRLKEFTLPEL